MGTLPFGLGLQAQKNPELMAKLQQAAQTSPQMARVLSQVMGGQSAQPQTHPASAEEIQRLYRDTLGRDASPEEIQSHVGNPGGFAGVMNTIKTSPEYQQLMANPIGIPGGGSGWGRSSPGQVVNTPPTVVKPTAGTDYTVEPVPGWDPNTITVQGGSPGSWGADGQWQGAWGPNGEWLGNGKRIVTKPGFTPPAYTPPREGGFSGMTIPNPAINQISSGPVNPWIAKPQDGLWSKPAQSSGGYLQALNPTGAYGASNSWDAISKGVTNLAGSMNKSANTSGYTKPRSSISLDPQPADPWTRPTRKQW